MPDKSNEMVTCSICGKEVKGEANLKRHTSAKHKDSLMRIISIPDEGFEYDEDLGIFIGSAVNFPPNYEFVSALNKKSIRSAEVNGRMIHASCIDVIVRLVS